MTLDEAIKFHERINPEAHKFLVELRERRAADERREAWQTRAVEVLRKLYCEDYGPTGQGDDGGCYYCEHCDECTAQMFMDQMDGENVVEQIAKLLKEADK